jgi:hypothetical protein
MNDRRTFLALVGGSLSILSLPQAASAGLFRRRCQCQCGPKPLPAACSCACPISLYATINSVYYWHCKCNDSGVNHCSSLDAATLDSTFVGGACPCTRCINTSGGQGKNGYSKCSCGSPISHCPDSKHTLQNSKVLATFDFFPEVDIAVNHGIGSYIPQEGGMIALSPKKNVAKTGDTLRQYDKGNTTRYVRLIELTMHDPNEGDMVLRIGQEVDKSATTGTPWPTATYKDKHQGHKYNHRVYIDDLNSALYHVQLRDKDDSP